MNAINGSRVEVNHFTLQLREFGRNDTAQTPDHCLGGVDPFWRGPDRCGAGGNDGFGIVEGFLAATNANDVVPAYLASGRFDPRASIPTLSNAMDVGNPSNFERLLEVFAGDWKAMALRIEGRAVSDERTMETMRRVYQEHGVHVDPHTAVGCAAAGDHLRERPVGASATSGTPLIVLSTAHPAKFSEIVRAATGSEPEMPERLSRCLALPKKALGIPAEFPALSEFLLANFA